MVTTPCQKGRGIGIRDCHISCGSSQQEHSNRSAGTTAAVGPLTAPVCQPSTTSPASLPTLSVCLSCNHPAIQHMAWAWWSGRRYDAYRLTRDDDSSIFQRLQSWLYSIIFIWVGAGAPPATGIAALPKALIPRGDAPVGTFLFTYPIARRHF